ncbi:hypothetical protein ACTWLI_07735 [Arthrobacter sp. Hor0625]|uniref:hypothetical protein n=1 Tax=Arthrobacter sp. Hor0625 TaxID=3457358 RepID=UPI00403E8D5A
MSLDNLRLLPWVAAAVFALAAGLWRPRKLHSTAVGAVLLFAALNAATGIYVLNHFGDPRWSGGGAQRLSAPSLAGTPVVGQFLQPLDAALNGVVGGVNDFLAFKEALPVALDFLGASGWALLLAFPLAVLAAIINYVAAKRRAASFAKYRATVDQLQVELDEVKRQLSLLGSAHAGSGVEAPAGRTGLAP